MKLILFLLFFFIFVAMTEGQSTLEYSTLTSGITPAAKAEEGKENRGRETSDKPVKVFDEGLYAVSGTVADILSGKIEIPAESQYASNIREVQKGPEQGPAPVVPEKEKTAAPGQNQEPEAPKEEKPAAVQTVDADGFSSIEPGRDVKVHMKDGHVIEGAVVNAAFDRVQVETSGVQLTYFREEIKKIQLL